LPGRSPIVGPTPEASSIRTVSATSVCVTAVEAGGCPIRIRSQADRSPLGCWRQVSLAVVKLSSIKLVALFVGWK
jgi:hypothetical protein